MPSGYLGTPGAEMKDIREWRKFVDFVLAAEKDAQQLRDLRYNVGRYFTPDFVQATGMSIEEVLARATDEWIGCFDRFEYWPCILNYDIYANPVLPQWAAFRRDAGFWRGMRAYLHAVQDALPAMLLLVTSNLRGRTAAYDAALDEILASLREYGIAVPPESQKAFLDRGMPKKFQICFPYWLSRFAATAEGFRVDIIESVDYVGTGDVRVIHLILKLRPLADPARASEITLRRLVNFPHQTLVRGEAGSLSRASVAYPIVAQAVPLD